MRLGQALGVSRSILSRVDRLGIKTNRGLEVKEWSV
jgi:hypothetical protein